MNGLTQLRLALAALALGATTLSAQQFAPADWNYRTMTGASFEVMTYDGAGLLMASLRSTHVGSHLVTPDASLGFGYVSGVLVSTIDLGIGSSAGNQVGLLSFSVGPTLLAAIAAGSSGSGAAAVVGLHGRVSAILPIGPHIGARLDVGRRYFFSNGESIGLWIFGFGVTGLGRTGVTVSH